MHSDYHQPSDEVSLVNWNKMLDIIKLGLPPIMGGSKR